MAVYLMNVFSKISQKTQFIKARHLLFISLVMGALMIASALIELNQSRKELFTLMEKQAHTLLETAMLASENTLRTNYLVEDLIEERLLNNANIIRKFYQRGQVSNTFLNEFAHENHIYRINIFNSKGKKIFSSHQQVHQDVQENLPPHEVLQAIFTGQADTLVPGLKKARHQKGFRFAVALAARDRAAIVLNLDARELLQFRKDIGFGSLVKKIAHNSGILYAALQDTSGILAASGNVQELERITISPFLSQSLRDSTFRTRITQFDSLRVFEAVHPFYFGGELTGLFRLGLSLEPLNAINARIYRRIIFISGILLVIGFILFSFLLVRQNLEIVNRQYQNIETYSHNIIQNVSDAIIVFDSVSGIKIFNQAAERLFGTKSENVIGKAMNLLIDQQACREIFDSPVSMQEMACEIQGKARDLLISKSVYRDPEERETTILVLKDLTEQKRLERQMNRRERLTALGQLASGVAHEIRNPLNAISTIIQQLDRDFEPASNSEEYHQLARLVHREVKRMNQTIENFLRFARPEPLQPEALELAAFFRELQQQYQSHLEEKNIQFQLGLDWTGTVRWDRGKMKQVFVNLMQNAIDAIAEIGHIQCVVQQGNQHSLEITFEDDGSGIPEQIRKKIFNLYFTTKAKGTGIGLSIVQRIIDQHGGVISLESSEGKGTRFRITLPTEVEKT